ncbi:MAG TPA: methenyltetrahydromethanopterin cyclohydrolase, partial [Methanocorpusculum sp.]|nr:methenyltetrahydromethanopterin cyclohydrolase [Methanocorpusculum sp.]
MVSVNELGLELFQELVEDSEWLNVAYHELDNGARIVDCGVNVPGSFGAGYYYTAICMGGLGDVNFRQGMVGNVPMTFIDISTDFPAISCLGAQKAGWSVKHDGFFAMGSGPARALSLQPKHTYEVIDYHDEAESTVICLEADKLPSESVMQMIADKCNVPVSEVCALVAPTSSLVGSIQVAGRCVETAVYKLNELGFDTRKIIAAAGTAPIPPVRGPKLAMGV